MAGKNNSQPISLKFLVSIVAVVIFMIFYATMPNSEKEIKKNRTYEESLEYNSPIIHKDKQKEMKKETVSQTVENTQQKPLNYSRTNTKENIKQPVKQIAKVNKQAEIEKYNALLDNLKEYPNKSVNSVEIILNKIISFKGYPQGLIKIKPDDIDQSRAKTQGSFLIASFEFPSGEMRISKEQIYALDIKVLIAIIAHEIDHFDKFAKVCKSMGVKEFKEFLETNGVTNFNEEFWTRAVKYTKTDNFDFQEYKNAIERYMNQNKIELTSSYSDFYRLAENMRNPLEISAYEVSDYIYNYYNIPITEGPMKQITQKFNEVDWAIYNKIKNNDILKDERIALFDYFFSKAIIKTSPSFKQSFDQCIERYDGDLTIFWLNFEKTLSNFYGKGQIDSSSVKIILNLLSETLNQAKTNITNEQIADALKYKVRTILSNIVYPNAIKNIRKTAAAYLRFINKEKINQPAAELDFILTLICIENELYTDKNNKISMYYLKLPEELQEIYKPQSKTQRFHFIYNNEAFKEKMKTQPNNVPESKLLSELLDSHRPEIRIKNN